MLKFFSCVALASAVAAIPASAPFNEEPKFLIRTPHEVGLFSTEAKSTEAGNDVFVGELGLEALKSLGIDFQVLEEAKPFSDKMSEGANFDGYKNLAGIYDFLDTAEKAYPSIAQRVSLSDYLGTPFGKTFEGRDIPILKISDNVRSEEEEPNVLIVSAHHSREIITPQIAMTIIDKLLKGYGADSDITAIVNNYEIFIAPIWNPDGYDYVWTKNNMWRKNRKPAGGNAFGVDLNRNYDIGWDSPCGGDDIPKSDTYRGPAAASEEETQTMVELHRRRNFAKVLDFHSYGREVLVSFQCSDVPDMLKDFSTDEGVALSKNIQGYAWRLPSADAEHQQWGILRSSAYSFLIETGTEFQPPFAQAQDEAEKVWPGVLAFFRRPVTVHGVISSGVSGDRLLGASVTLTGAHNVHWASDERFGHFHAFLPAGTHTFTVSAPGFQSVEIPVNIGDTMDTINLNIALFPSAPLISA
eukprot:TRINITY_DN2439_c0_g1::TRINITY_DN2439_c0_g1_i1::g.8814::m.8814 TRINITY_DN2439_c0_g1::TRINITY_DN2439_c0_g1_i1::g.8814  ORF type:complete len:499 (+),score=141.87,sp/P29068/CBPT_THEVU/31.83/6e-35,Peptidase_M14/PF00246.19/1.6e-51,CarboxypepD_reg/PF13620.1/1.6e-07,DUF4480/PF13715.1/3.6e-06 TRINITY_DN2439_c0_g1_i1:88-1497(+)